MSILPIRVFPDPILRRKARLVSRIDNKIANLATDMIETMDNAGGVGLAAPQVGVLKRVITLHLPEQQPMTMVNPEIVNTIGKRQVPEGCLSIPGYVGIMTRSIMVEARALDLAGSRLQLTAEELLAQAIEHEIDHLNGILFLDHLHAHEQLDEAGISPTEPHWHDVSYTVYAFKATPSHKDLQLAEKLYTVANLSKVKNDSSINDVKYDFQQP